MFSYIFMKILENRPNRYDTGISILTGGHANRLKKGIVQDYVHSGINMLDVGCGTGSLAIESAKKGAQVVGIDIAEGMLSVARKRVVDNDLGDRVTFHHVGASELDELFEDNRFDLITATLVMSELYPEERRWALREFRRILKPSGTLVLADEVKPKKWLHRVLYFLARLPLAFVTYVIAQTGTKAVSNINEEARRTGFKIIQEKNSLLGSFKTLSLKKTNTEDCQIQEFSEIKNPKEDFSLFKSLWDYIGRWFPSPVEPGLRAVGNPNENSPVLVTANFHLTVRRVEKALRNENCYLLVAPTNGINVWCASSGGEMTAHSIITVMKTSRIRERIRYRRLILPQFSAAGVDRRLLRQKTGWGSVWGPAYAKDISSFLNSDYKKTQEQSVAKYPLAYRLEMLLSLNFLMWALMGVILLIINPRWFLFGSVLFWGVGVILYGGYNLLPGKSGWLKAFFLSILIVVIIALFSFFALGVSPWVNWGWMVTALAISMSQGLDVKGSVGGNISEPEHLFYKLGIRSFGHLFSSDSVIIGTVKQDKSKCNGCKICLLVCPKGVFGFSGKQNEIIPLKRSECFSCNACVMQCPKNALSIG